MRLIFLTFIFAIVLTPLAAHAQAPSSNAPLCVYDSKDYSDGAYICAQKSMMLNCVADGSDLNALARAWATTSTDQAYSALVDLNGDNIVDGEDLALFEEYFGGQLPGCK